MKTLNQDSSSMFKTRAFRLALTCSLLIGLGLVVLASAGAKGAGGRWVPLHGRKQISALDALCALNFPSQLPKAEPLCTGEGFTVLGQMVSAAGYFAPSTFKVVGVKANPNLTDIEMVRDTAEGRSRIFVRLLDRNGWKFQDEFIAEHNGKAVNLWASYVVQHPVLSEVKVNWDDIMKVTEDVVRVCQELKALSQESRNP